MAVYAGSSKVHTEKKSSGPILALDFNGQPNRRDCEHIAVSRTILPRLPASEARRWSPSLRHEAFISQRRRDDSEPGVSMASACLPTRLDPVSAPPRRNQFQRSTLHEMRGLTKML